MKCKKCKTTIDPSAVITHVREDKIEIEVICDNPECNIEMFAFVMQEDLEVDADAN